ncbi:acireductone synthase [Plasticicumulans sp.]|uniref:acireductone synthase n=1 Tax=Plasticicumulans sp. TaxID=2307179 RepID=UPI002CEB343F|nr:acireductone synthase [Plasticicumulans sp.]HMX54182.1 acireductone synthase [Plasticicumulans sp.]HND97547.1 acireductone synthase [Plasticicumulans sp.]HNJ07807.1 acireductone synthase [Plasticicumulans sp.]HNM43289.1 acireductone synthase [Plasticicumulans sp.]
MSVAIRAILTDIEGTTSSIAFVHEVLFPYARARLPAWLAAHAGEPEVAGQLAATRAEAGLPPEAPLAQVIEVLLGWIDADRKATPLKALQGRLWADGYAVGDFHGHVYADVPPCLRAWQAAGLVLAVYSSGSVQAQQQLFAHTACGDLTPLFSAYFDTRIGHKREPASYTAICAALGLAPAGVLFLSDITEELDAARSAGLATVQLVRDGTPDPQAAHRQVTAFTAIDPYA